MATSSNIVGSINFAEQLGQLVDGLDDAHLQQAGRNLLEVFREAIAPVIQARQQTKLAQAQRQFDVGNTSEAKKLLDDKVFQVVFDGGDITEGIRAQMDAPAAAPSPTQQKRVRFNLDDAQGNQIDDKEFYEKLFEISRSSVEHTEVEKNIRRFKELQKRSLTEDQESEFSKVKENFIWRHGIKASIELGSNQGLNSQPTFFAEDPEAENG